MKTISHSSIRTGWDGRKCGCHILVAFFKLAFFKRINDKTNLVLVLILDLLFAMLLFSSAFFCNAVSKMNHLSVFTASTK